MMTRNGRSPGIFVAHEVGHGKRGVAFKRLVVKQGL